MHGTFAHAETDRHPLFLLAVDKGQQSFVLPLGFLEIELCIGQPIETLIAVFEGGFDTVELSRRQYLEESVKSDVQVKVA